MRKKVNAYGSPPGRGLGWVKREYNPVKPVVKKETRIREIENYSNIKS